MRRLFLGTVLFANHLSSKTSDHDGIVNRKGFVGIKVHSGSDNEAVDKSDQEEFVMHRCVQYAGRRLRVSILPRPVFIRELVL